MASSNGRDDNGRRKKEAVGRVDGEVIYEGRYVVVVWGKGNILRAYSREAPKGKEKEYLLLMLDELLIFLNELYEHAEDALVYIGADVIYGGEEFGLWADKYRGVWTNSMVKDYEKFIRTADKVAMEFAGRNIGTFYGVYRGRHIVVIKSSRGMLHAFARSDVWENMMMDRVSLMLAVIREVMAKGEKWNYREVVVRGRVWRNTVPFFPVVHPLTNEVDFVSLDDDYAHFVRMADEVRFIPWR